MLAQRPNLDSGPRPIRPPGLVERGLVVFVVFINIFGTPASWFKVNTGATSGVESDFLLSYGSFAIVLVLFIGLIGNGDAVVRILHAEPMMTAYFFFLGLSPIWSPRMSDSIAGVANMGAMLGLGIVLLVRFRPPEIFQLLAAACAVGIVMDLFWVLAMGPLGQNGGAWDGLGVQKNSLGYHALVSILVFLMGIKLFPRFRVIFYVLTIVATVLLVGSESKTSLGAAGVTAGSFVVFVVFRARKTLRGAVFLTLTVSAAFTVLLVTANLEAFLGALGRDVTFSGRIGLWGEVIAGIKRSPWLGYGYDGFWGGPLSDAHFIVAYREFDWGPDHAHNAFFESALHVGIPLTFLFVGFVVRGLARATDHVRWVRGPIGLFPLVYLSMAAISSFTESGIFTQRFGVALFMISTVMARTGVDDAKRIGVMRLDEERQLKKAGYEVKAVPGTPVPAMAAS